MRRLLAIDPGASGGWAWSVDGEQVETAKMPDSFAGIVTGLRGLHVSGGIQTLVLEKVGGYTGGPGTPGSAMFNFGMGYGFIQGAAMMAGMRVVLVAPQKWQKKFSLGTVKDSGGKGPWKRKLRDCAARLFPNNEVILGTADALLIFEWAQYENV